MKFRRDKPKPAAIRKCSFSGCETVFDAPEPNECLCLPHRTDRKHQQEVVEWARANWKILKPLADAMYVADFERNRYQHQQALHGGVGSLGSLGSLIAGQGGKGSVR